MYFNLSRVLAGLALGSLTQASPILKVKRSIVEEGGVKYTVFEHSATNSVVKFVTNSGICETTPGVNQYSGYFSVGGGM
jgi:carboxypeptidase D